MWCEAWSTEKKDAEKRVYRARCLVRCLEANLDRIEPEQFDELMARLESAREELHSAFLANIKISAEA